MMQNANTSVCSTTPWVGIDWGTTNIRAYHVANKTLMNQSSKQIHITDCAKVGFENTLDELIGDWDLRENTSILICGMAGSKMGWVEAPYVNCPASVSDLLHNALQVPHHKNITIIPGLSYLDKQGAYDVMRGEEVQLLGLFSSKGFSSGVVCTPGTHTKWVVVKDQVIEQFTTTMTGEVFGILSEHSILQQSLQCSKTTKPDATTISAGFERGLKTIARNDNILAEIFKVRTDALFGVDKDQSAADYLSGLLIGFDVKHSVSKQNTDNAVIPIIGPPAMSVRYQHALDYFGFESEIIDANAITLAGLSQLRASNNERIINA